MDAVLQQLCSILWSEFTNLIIERFTTANEYVLIGSDRSNYAITIHYKLPALLTLPLHHVSAMYFIPFGKESYAVSLSEDKKKRRKKGRDAALK